MKHLVKSREWFLDSFREENRPNHLSTYCNTRDEALELVRELNARNSVQWARYVGTASARI
jgi:hypothetical protein